MKQAYSISLFRQRYEKGYMRLVGEDFFTEEKSICEELAKAIDVLSEHLSRLDRWNQSANKKKDGSNVERLIVNDIPFVVCETKVRFLGRTNGEDDIFLITDRKYGRILKGQVDSLPDFPMLVTCALESKDQEDFKMVRKLFKKSKTDDDTFLYDYNHFARYMDTKYPALKKKEGSVDDEIQIRKTGTL